MIVLRKEFLLLASLLLITLFDVTSGCSRKLRFKSHRSSHSSYHPSSRSSSHSSYHPSSHSSSHSSYYPSYHSSSHSSYEPSSHSSSDASSHSSPRSSWLHNTRRHRSNHSANTEDNDHRYKREVSEYFAEPTDSLSTSCGQTLCASSPNYPLFAINKAVTVLNNVLTSKSKKQHKRYSQMRKRIDPMVINYFHTLQHVIYNYDLPEPGGCDHYLDVFAPEEGYSSQDQRAYFIVNLPTYHQRVQPIYCTSPGDVCENDFSGSMCQQVYRDEKLMVLPVDSEFDISSFRVKKFKVPNGCACSKPTSL